MIRYATEQDLDDIVNLAILMWEAHSWNALKKEFSDLIKDDHAKIFLQLIDNQVIGFAQCQLRFDYVEGTASSPVGYLEGVFIEEKYRKQGYGRALLAACETWAFSMGCKEFASDCQLDNDKSLQFHLQTGFTEVGRIICFKKFL